MLPVIALVGRPNVGKSTLFNVLTRTREAIVGDFPGLTRDRKFGEGRLGQRPYLVVDTGGLGGDDEGVAALMAQQAWQAVEESDAIVFLVDARDGLTPADHDISERLRRTGKPVSLAVNKTDGLDPELAVADFFNLGLAPPLAISAVHRKGIRTLVDAVLDPLPPAEALPPEADDTGIRFALIGRPNVGKSTLANRILGEERVLAFDQPGTTRDSIFLPFRRDDQQYTLIDTAGVRRRSRVTGFVEKFSVIKALQAMEAAHVTLLVLDAREGVTDQDATLAGYAADAGRALVIAVNKWDGLSEHARAHVKHELERKLPFIAYAETRFISALHGSGVGELFECLERCYRSAMHDIATSDLNRILEQAVQEHQPPLVRGRRIKLRYAHQGGRNPPVIVIHGNQTERLPAAYRRYLENVFRKTLRLTGTPIRIELKSGDNPYKGKRNRLTPRQERKRKRLKRHSK